MPTESNDQSFAITWRGIDLEIRHERRWLDMAEIDHIEVMSEGRIPLPITETGYRSLFIHPDRIEEVGGATDYVLAWLNHEAETEGWKRAEFEARQLSLF